MEQGHGVPIIRSARETELTEADLYVLFGMLTSAAKTIAKGMVQSHHVETGLVRAILDLLALRDRLNDFATEESPEGD